MAKAVASKKDTKKTPAPKAAPKVTRTRKTEDELLKEYEAKIADLKAKQTEKGEKKVAARATVSTSLTAVIDLAREAAADASKLPDFRKAGVDFGQAVKTADALGALNGDAESAETPGMIEEE